MALFEWGKKYSVGIASIDQQHQKLVEMLTTLHEAMKQEKGEETLEGILAGAVKYAQEHFSYEERLFSQTQYPEFEHHKQAHDAFARQANTLMQQFREGKQVLTIETWQFLKKWLEDHILGEDKKYTAHLKTHGVS
ncbi:bacteriohemerythrin [Bdellovibrionota bacterium FG-2]